MERQESMIERRLRQNVATVEQQAARISELEAQLAEAVIANKLNIAATYAERNVTSIAEGMIGELKARIAELEMHLAAAAETIAQHARADAAAWGASFEQQNEHAANATAQIRALLNGGMPVRDDTRRRDSRIAELEDLNDAYARQISEQAAHSPKAMQERIAELEESLANAEVRMDAMEADLAQARLLLVAIDENLDMDVNPLTYTTRRIVELLRDPARNPWASLMRAGKEER